MYVLINAICLTNITKKILSFNLKYCSYVQSPIYLKLLITFKTSMINLSQQEYQNFRIGSDGNLQGVGLYISVEPSSGHLVSGMSF